MTDLFAPILKGFAYVVKFCYNIGFHNYLVALILFALIVKIVMLPLSIKQQKNQIKQASLRPKEMAIRKKYAGRNDQPTQQKMQNEIMELYQRENFNPMGGCLPLLIQLPILLGLYEVIRNPLRYFCNIPKETVTKVLEFIKTNNLIENVKTIDQIKAVDVIRQNFDSFKELIGEYVKSPADLPDFSFLGINLANTPSFDAITKPTKEGLILLLVPILTFVFMFISMKITKKFSYNATEGTAQDAQAGCSMKVMDYMMPLMSTYITFIVPAVLGIYWIFNNIFGSIQQIILAKVMPLPKFSEEDYKKAEREMNGKSPKSNKKSKNGTGEKKAVRSLHRIDEDDYIAPPPEKKKKTEAKGLAGMIEKPEIKEEVKEVKEDIEEKAEEAEDKTKDVSENKEN